MTGINLAILGSNTLLGQKMKSILENRDIQIDNIYFYSKDKVSGKGLYFKSNFYNIYEINEENLKDKNINYALGALDKNFSKEISPLLNRLKITYIDTSSAFEMDNNIPLVVPEINGKDAINSSIISSPNPSAILLAISLYPIYKKYGIKRVINTTYQPVSENGFLGIEDLNRGNWSGKNEFYPHQIAYNIIPHIGEFLNDGYTKEEVKISSETLRILNNTSIKITSTAVRVPILESTCISTLVETEKAFDLDNIFELFKNENDVVLYDDIKNNIYPMPIITTGKDKVYIGRIRRDYSIDNGLNFICAFDNTRKGSALNAIEILEYVVNKK